MNINTFCRLNKWLSKKEKINCSTNDFCTSYTQDIDLFGLFYFCNFTNDIYSSLNIDYLARNK
jgi:hypothetical protein